MIVFAHMLPLIPLVCAFLLPQELGKIRGRVLTNKGKPRLSGEVFFFSPGIPKMREAFFLRVPIGSKGRFRAQVPYGRSFVCWSVFKDEEGRIHLSGSKHGIHPGMHPVLRERYVRQDKPLRLGGFRPWGSPQQLRLVWKLGEGKELITPIDKLGYSRIPEPLPFWEGVAHFVVQEKAGPQLFAGRVFLRGLRGENSYYGYPCPKPELRSFWVVDGRPGKNRMPVSGARIFFHMDEEGWLRGPLSDPRGEVQMTVPSLRGAYSFLYLSVSKPGFGRGYARMSLKGFCAGGKELRDPKAPLQIPLPAEGGRKAKFFGFAGKGLPGVLMLATPTVLVKGERWGNNETMKDRPMVGWSDARGELRLEGLSSLVNRLQFRFFLPEDVWEKALPRGYAFPLPRGVFRSEDVFFPGEPHWVFGLNLKNCDLQPFTLEAADGAPASFAKVLFLRSGQFPMQFQADRRGRGTLLLGKEGGVLLARGEGDEYFFQRWDPSGGGMRVLEPRVLQMKTVRTFVAGRVVDAEG
ncbi:MAG TPA: hypothetical protein ENK02_09870, partial [Planctomycetes bacterium]|nr:hypothetical protein [Planctomycetota bacterium]